MKNFVSQMKTLILSLYKKRSVIKSMAVDDLRSRFSGSYLGLIWTIIKPIITIIVYWIVFEFGLKGSAPAEAGNAPYIVWITCGLIPWFYFQETWSLGTASLTNYKYLVENMDFPTFILVPVRTMAALISHLVFVVLLMIIVAISGVPITIYALQLVYYIFCATLLGMTLSWITSALLPFFKDIAQIVNIVLQIAFWATPIVWPYKERLADHPFLINIIKLNPMFYIVEGFRDSLIYQYGIWERHNNIAYFWGVMLILIPLSIFVYRKLSPHFVDEM